MSDDEARVSALGVVARRMGVAREDFIARLFAATLAEIDVLDHDERLRALLEASISENLVAAIHYLERGGDAVDEVSAPSAALTYARTLAQRDVPLSALIRAYRMGHGRFVDEALPLIAEIAQEGQLEVAAELVGASAAYIDRVCDEVGRAYEVERDRWVSSRSGLRQQWLGEVLRGHRPDLEQAERRLDYRFDGRHVAAILWPGPDVAGLEVPRLLEEAAECLRRALGAEPQFLMVPNDEREVNAWFRLPHSRPTDVESVARALGCSRSQVLVALGQPSSGVDGFRRTLDEATHVARIRFASGRRDPAVTTYAQVEAVALMSGDLDSARRFVQRVLGELAGAGERRELLRGTLREFLARRGSFAATATATTMHRNTVQYQVHQAAELCAADVADPARAAEISAALELTWWLGRAVTA